jgi:hypothetical protein
MNTVDCSISEDNSSSRSRSSSTSSSDTWASAVSCASNPGTPPPSTQRSPTRSIGYPTPPRMVPSGLEEESGMVLRERPCKPVKRLIYIRRPAKRTKVIKKKKSRGTVTNIKGLTHERPDEFKCQVNLVRIVLPDTDANRNNIAQENMLIMNEAGILDISLD